MNDSRTMSLGQKLDEMGNGKRIAIIVVAVVVICALIWVVALGFRGRHIRRNAAAMARPATGLPSGSVVPRSAPVQSPVAP